MRYIAIEKLERGMMLGMDIYDGKGRVLLDQGTILVSDEIQMLQGIGCTGVYIEDSFSEEVSVSMAISQGLRQEALKMVNSLFQDDGLEGVGKEEILAVTQRIIEEIRGKEQKIFDKMDVKIYEDYTYFHSVEVAVLSAALGLGCGMEPEELNTLVVAALLHDIGKRFVEEDVLNAKRRLTDEERVLIVQHPKLGYEFLRERFGFPEEVCFYVLEHHEWYNGGGYPLRKSGSDIPLIARIVKMADVYDAMTSKLPYHSPLLPTSVAEYIIENAGAEFDPELVEVFRQRVAMYPAGCEVVLSNGDTALVLENRIGAALEPKVKVIPTGEVIDLSSEENTKGLTILELLL